MATVAAAVVAAATVVKMVAAATVVKMVAAATVVVVFILIYLQGHFLTLLLFLVAVTVKSSTCLAYILSS